MRSKPCRRARWWEPGWTALAQLGQAYWFFGNLYEAVVDVPRLVADAGRQRPPALLGSGSPLRYYAPVAPFTVLATARVLSGSWRSGGDRRLVVAAAASMASAAGLTAYLVRAVNLRMLRGQMPPDGPECRQLIRTWHRANAVRLLALAGGALTLRRASRTARFPHGALRPVHCGCNERSHLAELLFMTPELWAMLGAGGALGFIVGRSWAEVGRARHDGRRAMRGRKDWRKG